MTLVLTRADVQAHRLLKLEKVAINDALPLKAARRDVILIT